MKSRKGLQMFQCVTGDGWASQIARPMFLDKENNFDQAVRAHTFLMIAMLGGTYALPLLR